MSNDEPREIGSISWTDLTVGDAEGIRDFYAAVVGWKPQPHPMGEYDDYEMQSPTTGRTITGVCHARGMNEKIPPVWLVYLQVEDLTASLAHCREKGGEVLVDARDLGSGRMAVIRDPAGAVAALWQPA